MGFKLNPFTGNFDLVNAAIVESVSNSDGTLTISPTTGDVIASLNLSQANTWAAVQTFGNNISIGGGTFNLGALDDDEIIYFNGTNWTNRLELVQNNIPDLDTLDTSLTAGSVVFIDSTTHPTEDNANFFYDDTNNRVGVGVNSSLVAKVHVEASATDRMNLYSNGLTTPYTVGPGEAIFGISNYKYTSGAIDAGVSVSLYGINNEVSNASTNSTGSLLEAITTYADRNVAALTMAHTGSTVLITESGYGSDLSISRTGTIAVADPFFAPIQYGNNVVSIWSPTINNASFATSGIVHNYGTKLNISSNPVKTSGTIGDLRTYGIYMDVQQNTAATSNFSFGIWINSVTGNSPSGTWGVYCLADVKNYFKNSIGINQANPTARLHIETPANNSSGLDSPALFVDGEDNPFTTDAATDLVHLYRTIGAGGRFKTHKTLDVRLDVNESLNATTSTSIDRIGISTTIDNDTAYGSSFVQSAGTEDFIGHLISLDSEGTVTAAGDFDQRHFGIDLIVNDEQTWNNNAGSYNSTIYGARINTSHSGTVTAADSLIRLSYGVYIDCGVSASALDSATSYGLYINDVEGDTRWGIYDNSAENWYMNGDFGIGTTTPADKVHIYDDKNSNSAPSAAGLMVSDTGTMAAGVGGGIIFRGKYTSGGAETTAAGIHAAKTNGTSGNYSWDLAFLTRKSGGSYSETMRCTDGKDVVIGSTTANARLDVTNDSNYGKQLVRFSQSDADQPFVDFVGQASANTTDSISTHTTSGATTHHIQIEINGTKAWIAASTNNPSA